MEIWKDVVEFPGHYEISNEGRLRSKDRETPYITRHGTPSIRHQKGRVLKPKTCPYGYIQYCLTVNGKYFYRKGHTLVLEAFIGPRPSSDHQGDHIDFVRTNNELINLRWITRLQNTRRSIPNRPARHKYQKTVCMVSSDGIAFIFPSSEKAANALNISSGSISSALIKHHRCKGMNVFEIKDELCHC